jgi:TnpA family transposase
VLFDRATAWLVARKVLLPGATTLERLVARVRARASERLWRLLTAGTTPEQRTRLEGLIAVPDGERRSALDRLRDGPVIQSATALARAIRRLKEVQDLARDLPRTDRLPRSRVLALARFAALSKAQAIARMPGARRIATLLAFIRTLEASAQDDVLDLFDIVGTKILAAATRAGQAARLRTLRDLDRAALTLRAACAPLLDRDTPDTELRAAVFAAVPRETLEAALAQVDNLVQPPENPYLAELLARYASVRRFLPALAGTVALGANPAGRAVLEAVHYVRDAEGRGPRRRPPTPPLDFVPKSWLGRVVEGGEVDRKVWTMCLVERMRHALRRRDLYATPAIRYADPRIGLLAGAAWGAARTAVCRTLDLSPDGTAEVARLAERLDRAYRSTAARLPGNAAVRLGETENGTELVLSGLDKLDEPPGLVALRAAVAARLPRVDLPELLLEVEARTGFAGAFTHASEAGARIGDLTTSIGAVLVAEACNTGFEPLIRPDVPALRRSRLSWVKQNYLRAETIAAANARLVAAQNGIALARAWGGGDVASADGLRFVVPVRTAHAGPNPLYFGAGRGVTYYNLMSDRFTGLNGIVVPGTLRDSLVLLSVVLEQETELEPAEIVTDTGAYTDVIFAIFWLLGFQFSPRLADIGGARFWRIAARAEAYGPLNGLARHRVDAALIARHWDDLLRLAGSLKLGLVQAGGLMRMLQTNDRPTRLARALAELGRIIKTLYLLAYLDDEAYRRRILGQLNRHEGRHDLARVVFHGRRGELRQRYREGQEDQLGALGLVVNMIVLWNTIYMDAALARLRAEGHEVRDEDVVRLSPLGFTHINMLGRYAFTLPEAVARGELRPLRDPTAPADDSG